MLGSRSRSFLVLAATTLVLSGCDIGLVDRNPPTPSPAPSVTASSTPTITPTPSATPTVTAEPEAAEPQQPTIENISCDTMLDPAVDARLRAEGLVPAPKYDMTFGVDITGAHIACPWGTPGTLHSQAMYTFTVVTPTERAQYLAAAEENDYVAEHTTDGAWLTWENPYGGPGPDEGALLVADEWIASAPSREEIADIVWTR